MAHPTTVLPAPARRWPGSHRLLLAIALALWGAAGAGRAEAQENRRVRERLAAADTTQTLAVRTRDGSTFIGRLVDRDSAVVRLATQVGAVAVPTSTIVRVDLVGATDVRNGVYWYPNPNTTRLLFAPTGRMLSAGDGYVSDYELFFPGVAYGLTDRVTIGGGVSLFPGLGLDEQVYYVTPKVGLVSGERVNVAAGALVATVPGIGDGDEPSAFGILYGIGTYGGTNGSVTGGLGFGFADGQATDRPAVMVGGERRLSRRLALVTENYAVPGLEGALLSGGARFFGEQLAVDLAMVVPVGGGEVFAFPWVGFVFNF